MSEKSRPGQRCQIAGSPPEPRDKIVAVSLLTEEELRNIRTSVKRIYVLPADGDFDDLLARIAEATNARW